MPKTIKNASKTTKKRPKEAKTAIPETGFIPTEDQDLLDPAKTMVKRGMESLDRCVARVTEMLDGADSYDDKLGSHLSYIVKSSVEILREIRMLEKHERDRVKKMTLEQQDRLIVLRCKSMNRARRESMRELFDEMDREEGILSL